jgi:hypothetical protein
MNSIKLLYLGVAIEGYPAENITVIDKNIVCRDSLLEAPRIRCHS